MGLLGSLFGGNKNTENHAVAGTPAATAGAKANAAAKVNTNASAATPIDPKREIHFKFGTKAPISFKDAKTGLTLKVRGFGNASVLVEDTASYKSAEEVMETGREMASEALERFLQENSGNADFMRLMSRQNEINEMVGETLKQGRWKVMMVRLAGLSMDDESKQAYEKFRENQIMAENPALAQAMAIKQEAEAFMEAQKEQRRANGEEEKVPEDLVIYRGNPLPETKEFPKVLTNPLVIPFHTPAEIIFRDIETKASMGVSMGGVITMDTTDVPVDRYKTYADAAKSVVISQLSVIVTKVCMNESVENLRDHIGEMNEETAEALLKQGPRVKAQVRIEEIVLPAKYRDILEHVRLAQEMSDPERARAVLEEKMREQGITPEQQQAAVYRPKFCPNCGSSTGDSGKFCRNCGTKL
ncbi:MAG: SPFH domain-containing protein [Lachnospiraceae bacterium]|nr:SPFH domain-containing protein [Lachnospiraceae bacterium]